MMLADGGALSEVRFDLPVLQYRHQDASDVARPDVGQWSCWSTQRCWMLEQPFFAPCSIAIQIISVMMVQSLE